MLPPQGWHGVAQAGGSRWGRAPGEVPPAGAEAGAVRWHQRHRSKKARSGVRGWDERGAVRCRRRARYVSPRSGAGLRGEQGCVGSRCASAAAGPAGRPYTVPVPAPPRGAERLRRARKGGDPGPGQPALSLRAAGRRHGTAPPQRSLDRGLEGRYFTREFPRMGNLPSLTSIFHYLPKGRRWKYSLIYTFPWVVQSGRKLTKSD